MLADRQYMRRGDEPRTWSPTIVVLVLNILVFFLEYADGERSRQQFVKYGALSLAGLKEGFLWQFVTFQFLHDGLPHLVFNSLGLYFFGRPVEAILGRRNFIRLYLLSGAFGGVMQAALGFIAPERFGGPMVGASAGICGLFAAYALMDPDGEVLLFFILPMKAKFLMWGMLVVSILSVIMPSQNNLAHGAHLGGMLFAMAYMHWRNHPGDLFGWTARADERPRELVSTRSARNFSWRREKPIEEVDLPAGEFISKEVDPILDKISAHGIHSLTDRERQILEAARAKMSKRPN